MWIELVKFRWEAVSLIQKAARTAICAATAVAALDAREGRGAEVTSSRANGAACLAWQDLCALTGELTTLVTAGRGCIGAAIATVTVTVIRLHGHNSIEQNETDYCQENCERDA